MKRPLFMHQIIKSMKQEEGLFMQQLIESFANHPRKCQICRGEINHPANYHPAYGMALCVPCWDHCLELRERYAAEAREVEQKNE
jgi:hypothetical protein